MSTAAMTRALTAADLRANLSDIQDNVVAPILMRYGRHIFLKFHDSAKAREWMRVMIARVNTWPQEHGTCFTVNVGFTFEGLAALGLSKRSLDSFPQAFRMGARARAEAIGDTGLHAPEHWEGGLGGPDIHAMAWIRTDSDQGRELATRIVRAEMEEIGGIELRFIQDTMALAHANGIGSEGEHFGFADPISQPPIEGADAPWYPGDGVQEPDGSWRPLKAGEFVLGYEDEAGPAGVMGPEPFELRVNGTYMVFRKLHQDVAAFRRFLKTAAKSLYGSDDEYHQERVAAKMMGRWRSGCPVDLSPDKDDLAIAADPERRNNFSYAGDDEGLRCPIGAHLRRTNPRATPLKRATAVRRHRLIRRGVEYGPHLEDGALKDDGVDRGLINLFIQADIERQFEFVQKEWMKGGEFIGLGANEQDPINGVGGEGSQMMVPGAKQPFLFDLPSFVTVKGGEYLFVPGLMALEGLIQQRF
ncbi:MULTISPECIES: peroxidase [unclassified Mesorhizobium]|uniref:Dyp-type peroxidase n=1 Tax=unclassified Mesorhizobium TaxID=325217 RepID=UPI000FCB46BC|nr:MULTISPECIES: peroxidase [unclassified Mesorhizobium]RUW37475.1 peroxidase [Mesorhizobium sp. M1E.F.Ca.ET.041.01.1.1]RWD90816.1 MAG: peroxidase [Mesorhizobium sp.]RWD92234.1 MAG: peroxidase [Mesorhizobium sp.]TIV55510.1 MAG: peroxidase [Mesorhizobium sp.]